PGVLQQVPERAGEAGLRVWRAEHDPRDPSEDRRARAHRAGLQRDVQRAALQAPLSERPGGGPDREDLGMRSRVAEALALVPGRAERPFVPRDHRPDRDVDPPPAGPSLVKGGPHPPDVVAGRRSYGIRKNHCSRTTSPLFVPLRIMALTGRMFFVTSSNGPASPAPIDPRTASRMPPTST